MIPEARNGSGVVIAIVFAIVIAIIFAVVFAIVVYFVGLNELFFTFRNR